MTPAQGEPVYGSVGQLLPSFTAWIRDPETGESLPPNKKGEIMLKGPAVVTRYLNRPDATAEAFVDGYLASGDIGWIDENGNWAIADRIKEMIKTNGLQVAPAEVEDLILQSSHDIVECAVVAGPHATAGHVPVAYIVLRDRSLAQKAIDTATEFLKERMANYKIPRTWRIVDGLTKTASGKVMRRAMGDLETNGHWDSKAKL